MEIEEKAAQLAKNLREVTQSEEVLQHLEEMNYVVWGMAKLLGEVPEGADTIAADAVELFDRLESELVQLRKEKEQWDKSKATGPQAE